MSWVLFWFLATLHPVAFVLIAWYCETWPRRLLWWTLLAIPAVLYCWDYYAIQREHAQMCAAEGGLRVLIQPEKADRVRFVGVELRNLGAAQGTLRRNYPGIQAVEALKGEYDGTDGKGQPYVVYTVAPNPKAGQPMAKDPWKEPERIYPFSILAAPDPTLYEISAHETKIAHGTRKETRLSKEGKVYAKYTELVHWWTGIQYPDALPTWRCPDLRAADAVILPYEPLIKLILK